MYERGVDRDQERLSGDRQRANSFVLAALQQLAPGLVSSELIDQFSDPGDSPAALPSFWLLVALEGVRPGIAESAMTLAEELQNQVHTAELTAYD